MGEYQALPQTEIAGLPSPGYHLEMQDMSNRPSTASSKSVNAVNNGSNSNGSSSAGSDRANSLSRYVIRLVIVDLIVYFTCFYLLLTAAVCH